MRTLRLARMMEESEDPVVFGLIRMPKARIGMKTKRWLWKSMTPKF